MLETTNQGQGVLNAFSRYVEQSTSLSTLTLADHSTEPNAEPGGSFASICSALGSSPSLHTLVLGGAQANAAANLEMTAKSLAQMIVNCTSLKHIMLYRTSIEMDPVCNALSSTEAVRNFDLSFRRRSLIDPWGNVHDTNPSVEQLDITRPTPWKRLLSLDDIPLNLWPLILAETRVWDEQTSHDSLDALFLLMKEKSAILLQNVKRRKIRKRKRFRLSA